MNEKALNKQLRNIAMIVTVFITIILVICALLTANIFSSLERTSYIQIQSEAEEYGKRIAQRVNDSTRLLKTLASMIGVADTLQKADISQLLYEANRTSQFASMSFFDLAGNGISTTATSDSNRVTYGNLAGMGAEAQEIIQESMDERETLSDIYYSPSFGTWLLAFSVPVVIDDQFVGVLSACKSIDTLTQILEEETILNGSGYIDLLNAQGQFLVRSKETVIEQDIQTIYDGPYLRQKDETEIIEAMRTQEPIYSSFHYGGDKYFIYLEPVRINGWYVCCVDTENDSIMAVHQIFNITVIVLLIILVIIIVFSWQGYRLIRRKNQELLTLAYVDPVTGANNYTAFLRRLQDEGSRLSGIYIAALNIHQFKFVNELFGQRQANQLLCNVQKVLAENLRNGEYGCRENGDQFYILLREGTEQKAKARIERIMGQISQLSIPAGQNYKIGMYAGAVCGSDSNAMTHVLFALRKAQKDAYNTVSFFDEELHKEEELGHYILTHMSQALADGEFKLYLQSKVDLRTGCIGGAEALIRWQMADGTLLSPA